MDAGRFGRALGEGAREAAKAAMKAAEAAASPSPTPVQRPAHVIPPTPTTRPSVTQPTQRTAATAHNLKRSGKRFGEAIWGPFARLSGVLVLEVTGVLFGMFALVAGLEAWKGRASFQAGAIGPTRLHEILAILMTLFFAYLTLSNFLKAAHRNKQ